MCVLVPLSEFVINATMGPFRFDVLSVGFPIHTTTKKSVHRKRMVEIRDDCLNFVNLWSFCSSCRLLDLMHNTWWWQILKLWNAKFVLGHNLNRTCHSQWCQYDGDYSFKVCWLWKRSCICTSLQWKHLLKYSLWLLKKKIGLN